MCDTFCVSDNGSGNKMSKLSFKGCTFAVTILWSKEFTNKNNSNMNGIHSLLYP